VPLRQIRDDSRPISDVPLILANPQPLGARTHRPMGRMDTRSLHAPLPALIDHCSSLNIGRDQRRNDDEKDGYARRQGKAENSTRRSAAATLLRASGQVSTCCRNSSPDTHPVTLTVCGNTMLGWQVMHI